MNRISFFLFIASIALAIGVQAQPAAEATPAPVEPPPSFIGVWQVADSEGDAFNLCVFEDGRVVTNWAKGPNGAKGERGLWRIQGKALLAFYGNGWSDRLSPDGAAYRNEGFAPGTPLSNPPTNHCLATRVQGPMAEFSGVWRLNREPDGSYLYVSLQSNGLAASSIKENGRGKWEIVDDAARVVWEDGWMDVISQKGRGYVKKGWAPGAKEEPTEEAEALKVGAGLKLE